MTNNQSPFIDVSGGGFSSGRLTLVFRNVGSSTALVQSLESAGEQIDLPKFSLAPGDVVKKEVDLSTKKITRESQDQPKLRLVYRGLDGRELSTETSVEQTTRADGGFNIGKIEGSEPGVPVVGVDSGRSSSSQGGQEYDVALSYAGEDREFVEAVYTALRAKNVSVFFDRAVDEEIKMWGEDILSHLRDVYGTGKARYCVAFISNAYREKAFPTYELQNAVAHAVTKNPGSVLPILLEGDELPSPLVSTTAYIKRDGLSAEQIADKITAKVTGTPPAAGESTPRIKMPRVPSARHDPFSDPDNVLEYLVSELAKRGEALKDSGIDVSVSNRGKERIVKVRRGSEKIYNLAVWLGGMTDDDDLSFFQWNDRRMGGTNSMHAFGGVEWSQEKNAHVVKLLNVSLFKDISATYFVTPPELVEMLWERVVEEIEQYHERSR